MTPAGRTPLTRGFFFGGESVANSAAPSVSAKQFYEALWANAPTGFVELQLIRPNTKDSSKPDEVHQWFHKLPDAIDDFVGKARESSGQWNVYHGVGVRSRMRGKNEDIVAVTALWCDVDFKMTPEDKARKLLHEFPLKPSAVLRTGGGIHVYWFLKEAIAGADLARVRPLNLAIAGAIGGDRKSCDLRRVLRSPESSNIKPSYPDPKPVVTITWFKPELRYDLSAFDILPQEEVKAKAEAEPGEKARPAPSAGLLPETITKMSELLSNLWAKGWRHAMALDVAGMLAHAGVDVESAKAVVRGVSNAVGGQTEARVKDVEDTYKSFTEGREIAGATSIEKMISEEWPEAARPQARKTLNEVRKLLPRRPKKLDRESEPDFQVVKIVKFDSRPAIWEITLKHESGRELVVKAETQKGFFYYRDFQPACLEQNNLILTDISQSQWQRIINESMADLETREAPKEARVDGAIDEALNQFVAERKADPQIGELKSFPGYDVHGMFFKLSTFKTFLRGDGIKATERDLCQTLRNLGWSPESKRMGESVVRLWKKGTAGGNGHKPHELFETTGGNAGKAEK